MKRLRMSHERKEVNTSMAPVKSFRERLDRKATGLGALKTLAVVAATAAGAAFAGGEILAGAAAGAVAIAAYVAYEAL